MRIMQSMVVMALSLVADAARFFAPDQGRDRHHRPRIDKRPRGPLILSWPNGRRPGYDPALAEKYQAARRWRKALEWERQSKWRACLQAFRRPGSKVPAAYMDALRERFPNPTG